MTEHAYYPTIASASQVEWLALTARVPRVYYALQLLLHGSTSTMTALPTAEAAALLPEGTATSTVARLQAMLTRRAELLHGEGKGSLAPEVTPVYLAEIARNVGCELAPVCAVLGGMVASEVIKIISGREQPINNVLFFNGLSANGVVARLGPSFDCPGGGLDKGDFTAVEM